MKTRVEKKLSANDIGATGAHQAGILIPKKDGLLDFFPPLDSGLPNPRAVIHFCDDLGQIWRFNYIYYNNKLRGGTRNEYRLTGMTAYLRSAGAKIGDVLIFEHVDDEYKIGVKKSADSIFEEDEDGVVTLVLDNTWKVISF